MRDAVVRDAVVRDTVVGNVRSVGKCHLGGGRRKRNE